MLILEILMLILIAAGLICLGAMVTKTIREGLEDDD